MKVLFITPHNFTDNMSGGAVCSIQNFESLCTIFGKENVSICQINSLIFKTKLAKLSQYIRRLFLRNSISNTKEIAERSKSFDLIYIDISKYGHLAKTLRKNKFKKPIVTFFHNCEYKYTLNEYKNRHIFFKLISLRWAYYTEKCALKYSDTTICLNTRDKNDILDIYNKKIDFVIPIYMHDRAIKRDISNDEHNKKLTLLFIGSAFHANIFGIKWFLKNVMPYVNIHLIIVGKGMGFLRNEENNPDIEIFDSVPDLSEFFFRADSMLFPIFDGSGMKVKTCESLMYGKYIIGTQEAFEGYDLEYSKIGACCSTANEFIDEINKLEKNLYNLPRYNFYARNIYEKKFSPEVNIEALKKALKV